MARQKRPNNKAAAVKVTPRAVVVTLKDGRVISTPLGWHKPLVGARPAQRRNAVILGAGSCIEWPDLDYDVCVLLMLNPLGPCC